MRIVVNGEDRSVDEGLTVADLLKKLSIEPTRCAVERNKTLVPRAKHAKTPLGEADDLEIVTLAGGG